MIQHGISSKEGAKPLPQKLGKINMSHEPIIEKELTKLLDVRITYKIRHHTWVSLLSYVHNKFMEIHLCIDFINLNRSWNKKNYPVPSLESMLHVVSEEIMFYSPKGLSGYHQVPVVELDSLILIHEKFDPHMYHLQSLDGKIENIPINTKISSITFSRSGRTSCHVHSLFATCCFYFVFFAYYLCFVCLFYLLFFYVVFFFSW